MKGHLLKKTRLEKGLTIKELAKLSETSYDLINTLEKTNKPSRNCMYCIANIMKALEIRPNTVLDEDDRLYLGHEHGVTPSGHYCQQLYDKELSKAVSILENLGRQ